jgi:hydroxymethylpyrimidine pyrophosphatase-like HAD family hydrolase
VTAPRLVATDLDGTLVRTDGSVSDYTRRVLAAVEESGVIVVMVTARPMRWMHDLRPFVGEHGLAIVSNGAIRYDVAGDRPISVIGLEVEPGLAMVERIRAAVPTAQFAVETPSGIVLEPGYTEPHHVPPGSPVGPLAEVWAEPAVKVLVREPDLEPERLRELVFPAVGDDATPTWTVPHLIEIGPPGIDKALALAALAEDLDVPAQSVWAFGDMPNDLAMLEWAGVGHAVANADESVRAVADRVVGSNDEDGVARTLAEALGLEPL